MWLIKIWFEGFNEVRIVCNEAYACYYLLHKNGCGIAWLNGVDHEFYTIFLLNSYSNNK